MTDERGVLGQEGGANAAGVFQPTSHPVLRSVDPVKVAQFLRERERYEIEIDEKKKEVPGLTKASYKVSLDPGLLRRMHFLGRLDKIAPNRTLEELTSAHVSQWVQSLVDRQEGTFDHAVIEKAMSTLKVPMNIADPESRMLEYVNEFFSKMESIGYDNFKEVNPKKIVKLLQSKLYPAHFKTVMQKALDYHEPIQKDVKAYVELLCEEARAYEKYKTEEKEGWKGNSSNRIGSRDTEKTTKRKSGNRKRRNEESGSSEKPKPDRPLCLNPVCAREGKHHWTTTECGRTSKEEAKRLVQEYRKSNRRGAKKVKEEDSEGSNRSTLVRAMFAKKVTRFLCADGGSDINLLPQDLLEELIRKEAILKVSKLNKPRRYGLAIENDEAGNMVYVMCDREVTLNIELFIRHGCYLELRTTSWYVAMGDVSEPLLGRPTLEALGINTKELLAAAVDRMGTSVDLSALLQEQDYPDGKLARILSQGVYDQDKGILDENFDDENEAWLDLGQDSEAEIDDAIIKAVSSAGQNGISTKGQAEMKGMLQEFRDVLRVRLGNDPPAKVEPMTIEIKKGANPVAAKPRRYAPQGRKFMDRYVDRVLEYGFGKITTTATWIAAPVLVAKPPPAHFRLTFDYRPVNAVTIPMTWPMPHIDSELCDMAGSLCFAIIDFVSGYWQLPLAEASQELLSFMTSKNVVRPTRCTQGAKNAGANFQAKVEPLFNNIREHIKAWLDDFVLHCRTENDLLATLEKFFLTCREANLKISIRKSQFFLQRVRWCGRIIDSTGVQFDPRNLSGIQGIESPKTAGELCEYVHCLQWMSYSIPDFPNRVALLKSVLEEAYEKSGARTKKSIQAIRLSSLTWNTVHECLFREFQEDMKNMVKLAHRDPKKSVCIYTDASDEYWAGVVTQCDNDELNKDVDNQKHQPLAFLGAAFKGSEELWTTFEKEAYAIFQVFKKLDYLLSTEEEIHLYTDHRNLLFVFNPLALDPTLGRHVVNKVQRWGLYLSKYPYIIEHVEGEKNVMADIMTRWCRGYRGKRYSVKRATNLLLEQDVVESPLSDEFTWPDSDHIVQSQRKHHDDADDDVVKSNNVWTIGGKTWIPPNDADLQLKLLVIAHCGFGGHRGRDSTLSIVRENFWWKSMDKDCSEFIAACLHCITAKTGHKIPRPLSTATHGKKPNEVIHFDYLYMGQGAGNYKYNLVIRDDLSSYLWIVPATNADAETAATEIARWIRVFTVMPIWVSDQGSHFKNLVMEELAKEHHIKHNFTVAYSPWVNGTVEICMKQIQTAFRCLQSEMKLGPQDWPRVMGMIQTALNEAPLRRPGSREDGTFRTPLEVMTGIKPARVMLHTTQVDEKYRQRISIEKIRALQVVDIEGLQRAFDGIHKEVERRVTANRAKQIKWHNQKTNLVAPNFLVGDFVLIRRAQDKGHKQNSRWLGPRRILKVLGELVYDVQDIVSKKIERVHAARMVLYKSNMEGKEVSKKLLQHAEHSERKYELVEKLIDISGDAKNGIYIQVKWVGLPDKSDWTWQSLPELHEDIPDQVENFLKTTSKKRIAEKAWAALGLKN